MQVWKHENETHHYFTMIYTDARQNELISLRPVKTFCIVSLIILFPSSWLPVQSQYNGFCFILLYFTLSGWRDGVMAQRLREHIALLDQSAFPRAHIGSLQMLLTLSLHLQTVILVWMEAVHEGGCQRGQPTGKPHSVRQVSTSFKSCQESGCP